MAPTASLRKQKTGKENQLIFCPIVMCIQPLSLVLTNEIVFLNKITPPNGVDAVISILIPKYAHHGL